MYQIVILLKKQKYMNIIYKDIFHIYVIIYVYMHLYIFLYE